MTSAQKEATSVNEELRTHVAKQIGELQKRLLANDPNARAALAQMRRTDPTTDEGILDALTLGFREVPESLIGRGDSPSRAEIAIGTALSLYSIHQQSQKEPMSQSGWGLGRAVRQLANPTSGDSRDKPVMRRFNALTTSTDPIEATRHIRGLVTQFRSERIPLDYGRLAEDIYWLQSPKTQTRVKLNWARDLARFQPNSDSLSTHTSN